jgi:hypothetical protein
MSLTINYDKGYRKFPPPEQRLFGFGCCYKVSRLFTLKIKHIVFDFQGKITL